MPPPAECQKGELHHGKTGAGAVVSDGLANTHQRLEILQRANLPDCSKVEIKAHSKQSKKLLNGGINYGKGIQQRQVATIG